MNEKINKLWDKAVNLIQDNNDGDWSLDACKDKFAELIVKECSRVIVNGGYRNPALGEKHPLTPPEIAKMIEEHFGVEE